MQKEDSVEAIVFTNVVAMRRALTSELDRLTRRIRQAETILSERDYRTLREFEKQT
jgi:hypothetical protein